MMTTHPSGTCQQCGMPGLLYETDTAWLCDECTALYDIDQEQDAILRRERRNHGHAGHNDRNVDYASASVAATSTDRVEQERESALGRTA